jgi:predicted Zn-dependent protease with MMP-like domain
MNRDRFYETIDEAIVDLPAEFKEVIDNIEIIVDDIPDPETAAKFARGGMLLGLYTGIPLTLRGTGYALNNYTFAPPDRIFLYQKNIERYCRDSGKSLVNQIRETLFHEVGHYLGLSEKDLEDLKYRSMN